jgi:hypothetical protein
LNEPIEILGSNTDSLFSKRGLTPDNTNPKNGISPRSVEKSKINDTKGPEFVKEYSPSRVIHIGNTPPEATEAEIVHLAIPFGQVTKVVVLKSKNQALLEMDFVESASAMVNYFRNSVAQITEGSIYMNFSKHKELKGENKLKLNTKSKKKTFSQKKAKKTRLQEKADCHERARARKLSKRNPLPEYRAQKCNLLSQTRKPLALKLRYQTSSINIKESPNSLQESKTQGPGRWANGKWATFES